MSASLFTSDGCPYTAMCVAADRCSRCLFPPPALKRRERRFKEVLSRTATQLPDWPLWPPIAAYTLRKEPARNTLSTQTLEPHPFDDFAAKQLT